MFSNLNLATRFYTALLIQEKNQCIIERHSISIACYTVMCVVIMLLIDEGHLVFPHVFASCLGKGNTVSFLFSTPSASLILFFSPSFLFSFFSFLFSFFSFLLFFPLLLFTWQGTIYTSHIFPPNLFMLLTFEISITSLCLLEFWHF